MMEKRIDRVIFTCGGTAGHVNPAIAVAQLLAEKNPDVKILFVGAEINWFLLFYREGIQISQKKTTSDPTTKI